MKSVLPIALVAVSIAAGGAAAQYVRSTPDVETSDHSAKASTPVTHSAATDGPVAGVLGYYKFNRPFIVPVVAGDDVTALAMLALSVEMDEKAAYDALVREPRLRDGFMRVLIGLSHDGYFAGDITDPERFEEIRRRLKAEADIQLGETVTDVLIIDYARQAR